MGLNRIYAGVFAHNKYSMRALEKNGFRFETIAHKSAIKNDIVLDEHKYAIVQS